MSRRARRLRRAAILAWCWAAAALLAALLLTVWFDREGGTTLLLLRRTPALAPSADSSVPWEALGWVLTYGDEWGVTGRSLVLWNARVGVWASALAAIFFSALAASCPTSQLATHPVQRALRPLLPLFLSAGVVAATTIACTCEVRAVDGTSIGLRLRTPSLKTNRCYEVDAGAAQLQWSQPSAKLYHAFCESAWHWPVLLTIMAVLGLRLTRTEPAPRRVAGPGESSGAERPGTRDSE